MFERDIKYYYTNSFHSLTLPHIDDVELSGVQISPSIARLRNGSWFKNSFSASAEEKLLKSPATDDSSVCGAVSERLGTASIPVLALADRSFRILVTMRMHSFRIVNIRPECGLGRLVLVRKDKSLS